MLEMKKYKRPVAAITVVGENVRVTPGILTKYSKVLSDMLINIYNVSVGESSFSIFVDQEDAAKAEEAFEKLSETVKGFKSIDVRQNIGMISISSAELIDTPGVIHQLTQPLAEKRINLLGISTSFDSILLFVDISQLDTAYEVLHVAIVNGRIKFQPQPRK